MPETPPFPSALQYLWGWFLEISMGLAVTGMATPVVTWEALFAWCALSGTELRPLEARALVRLGALRASVESEAIEKKHRDGAQGQNRSDRA